MSWRVTVTVGEGESEGVRCYCKRLTGLKFSFEIQVYFNCGTLRSTTITDSV